MQWWGPTRVGRRSRSVTRCLFRVNGSPIPSTAVSVTPFRVGGKHRPCHPPPAPIHRAARPLSPRQWPPRGTVTRQAVRVGLGALTAGTQDVNVRAMKKKNRATRAQPYPSWTTAESQTSTRGPTCRSPDAAPAGLVDAGGGGWGGRSRTHVPGGWRGRGQRRPGRGRRCRPDAPAAISSDPMTSLSAAPKPPPAQGARAPPLRHAS